MQNIRISMYLRFGVDVKLPEEPPPVLYQGEHVISAAEVEPEEYKPLLGNYLIVTDTARWYENEDVWLQIDESRPGLAIPSDGFSDGGVPYSDEELAIINGGG